MANQLKQDDKVVVTGKDLVMTVNVTFGEGAFCSWYEDGIIKHDLFNCFDLTRVEQQ